MKILVKTMTVLSLLFTTAAFAGHLLTIHVVNHSGETVHTAVTGQDHIRYIKRLPATMQNNESADLVVEDMANSLNNDFAGSYTIRGVGKDRDVTTLSYIRRNPNASPLVSLISSPTQHWGFLFSDDSWDATSNKAITYVIHPAH